MAYLLDSIEIRRPYEINEANSTQVAVQRTLDGTISRDYFGANKRVWTLSYVNVQKAEHDIIKAIYTAYLNGAITKTWEITEPNYTVSSVLVHVDMEERDFTVRGSDYLSDFTLTLTEA